MNDYLAELEAILYDKGYFGFEESAREYVHEMIGEIMATLPTRLHRPAPRHFDPEGKGMWMASFRRSRNTTWYVFFTRYRDRDGSIVYLVHRMENNHTAAQFM